MQKTGDSTYILQLLLSDKHSYIEREFLFFLGIVNLQRKDCPFDGQPMKLQEPWKMCKACPNLFFLWGPSAPSSKRPVCGVPILGGCKFVFLFSSFSPFFAFFCLVFPFFLSFYKSQSLKIAHQLRCAAIIRIQTGWMHLRYVSMRACPPGYPLSIFPGAYRSQPSTISLL